MGFRSVEISKPSEIHVELGQLKVIQEDIEIYIPLEDISVINCTGANIRLSTMAIQKIVENGIIFQCIDEKYMPKAIIISPQNNSRQTLIMNKQIDMTKEKNDFLWKKIIESKIENQSRVLSILGKSKAEKIALYALEVENGDSTSRESIAAKEYFENYYPGINRREESPINSCLNYGYAVLRSAIIRSLITSGFLLSRGIFHNNQFNAFNLADDIIEPWRPIVDLIAYGEVSSEIFLTKEQKYNLANILHTACYIDNRKVSVLQ